MQPLYSPSVRLNYTKWMYDDDDDDDDDANDDDDDDRMVVHADRHKLTNHF